MFITLNKQLGEDRLAGLDLSFTFLHAVLEHNTCTLGENSRNGKKRVLHLEMIDSNEFLHNKQPLLVSSGQTNPSTHFLRDWESLNTLYGI